ncbi:M949_RS01915 family surface polysaccharide biosynthesis protein [Emticicia soli]|uniref:M949_RS01915 family surface polysaccharide biosynthesis protein n=1 Tax=Emticicia soli TaxID=2027878 RepID=A0ABW5JA45_9BACT
MKHILNKVRFLAFVCLSFQGLAQKIVVKNMKPEELKKFNTAGTVVLKSVQFNDKNGLNYVIGTLEENAKDDYSARILIVEHFKDVPGKEPKLLRLINDFEKDCPVDNMLDLVADSFLIDDLDKNGYAEIIFLYKTGCKGDVSPSGLKLIVLENGNKAAIRGKTIIKQFNTPREKVADTAFMKLPKVIQDKANALWSKFEYEY